VTLLVFVAVALGFGAASVLLRRRPRPSAAIGVGGLVLALVAASVVGAGGPIGLGEQRIAVGGVTLAGTPFIRLFLVLCCAASLLLALIAAATSWSRTLPGASLVALGALAFALGVSDPAPAILAATTGGLAAMLVALPGSTLERSLPIAAAELRALTVAGAVAFVAVAIASTSDAPAADATGAQASELTGFAYLAVAGAAAIRFGAIPFHLRAARVADAAPAVGLPLVSAWGPAAFAVVALGWTNLAVSPATDAVAVERAIVAITAVASIGLGTAAALLHDDLEHIVAYSIVADAGVALLGLAALDAGSSAPARMWLLGLVASKTALAAWAAAIAGTYGTNRLSELSGWARRSPILVLALLAIALASVGWPGMATFSARRELASLAVGGPLDLLIVVLGLASVTIHARLLLAGLARPGATVAGAPSTRPIWPGASRRRRRVRLDDMPEVWRSNRPSIAALATLALASIALSVSSGGLGAQAAAAAPAVPYSSGASTQRSISRSYDTSSSSRNQRASSAEAVSALSEA
jgi:NADH-quinone oxidoreductase subunit N